MDKLEKLRARVARYQEFQKLTEGGFDIEDFSDDVVYLLSIIELVEQDLTYMKQYGELNNVVDQIKFSVDSALKAIRA